MNRKIICYLVIGITLWFSLWISVSAKETEVPITGSLYSKALEKFPFTENSYNQLKDYFNNYINENLDPNKTYLLISRDASSMLYLITKPVDFNESTMFKVKNASFFAYNPAPGDVRVSYSFSEDSIVFSNLSSGSYSGLASEITTNFRSGYSLIWSNKPLKYDGPTLEDYYSYTFSEVPEALKKHYSFNKLSYDLPIYTYTNLLFGDYEEVKEKVGYRIEYYFDDVLDINKTEMLFGYVGDTIDKFTDQSSELYKLYSEGQNYVMRLSKDENLNVLKIYYRSPLYGTEKTPIDTNVKDFYFFYNFSDIKGMFPSIKFENFTQFEQLLIVIVFNGFYCLFLFFAFWCILHAFNKCWTWVKSFIF